MTLREELQTEQVQHLNLTDFSRVTSDTTIGAAIAGMRAEHHHTCLVLSANKLVGIVTERDILRKVIGGDNLHQLVTSIMTPDPITVTPDFPAADALWLMDRKGIRNLPVVDVTGKIVGNMTHKCILDYLAARYPTVVLNRPPAPDLVASTPEGG
ncbi:MAG: CBS domain-containing protein [Anaerolineales bacterium]|nr:CBS domain-containing protein [Anaerolineales bacterium]MCB8950530.1 CBS domain-containing protein [Ardenticatenales bacterium]